jgi:catechol 2,3-dioxygenase-like lactoylglutathione lyase family enzyme
MFHAACPDGTMKLHMQIDGLHHIALTVTDLERSRRFYHEILGLSEIPRPPFSFPGAWFAVGETGQQLHLIVHTQSTFREGKPLDTRDLHFAVRVPSYARAVEFLRAAGYREDISADEPLRMILRPQAVAGYPQIYILDPDRHVIEINADSLD